MKIARIPGEAFDADQITPNCEECGRDEYSCDCIFDEDGEWVSFGEENSND